jgi:hypothetical protein
MLLGGTCVKGLWLVAEETLGYVCTAGVRCWPDSEVSTAGPAVRLLR